MEGADLIYRVGIALSMTALVPDALSAAAAAKAIAIAVAANTLAKSAYALALGSRRFGVTVAALSVLALAAGTAAFLLTGLAA